MKYINNKIIAFTLIAASIMSCTDEYNCQLQVEKPQNAAINEYLAQFDLLKSYIDRSGTPFQLSLIHIYAGTIYNTAMGTNPYRYPDIDFYSSDYLRKFYTNSDVTGEVYGGNEKTHYYLNFGMNYANSLLKYGESKKAYDMSFNVRGNVDMALASWLKATTRCV